MAEPLTLLAFALSTKYKANKKAAEAQAAAEAKEKITTYVFGENGLRRLTPTNNTLNEKANEKFYGFSKGDSDKIEKFPEEQAEMINLYQNPYNKDGPEITMKEYNAMNAGFSNIDTADSTTTTKLPLGKVVGQRNPVTNEMNFYEGYKRFAVQKQKTVEYGIIKNNKFVVAGKDQNATHTRVVEKENGNIVSTSVPAKIEQDKNVVKSVNYYDSDNRLLTDISGENANKIAFTEEVTTTDGKVTEKGVLTEYKVGSKKDLKQLVFLDKDGERTKDRTKAVKTRIDTYDYKGLLIEEGEEKDYQLVKEKDEKFTGKTEYMMVDVAKEGDKDFKPTISIVGEDMAISRINAGTHVIIKSRVVDEKGKPGEFKDYSPTKDKNTIQNVNDNKDIVTSFKFATEKKDRNLKTVYETVNIFKGQTSTQSLIKLNNVFARNSDYIDQVNNNPILKSQVGSTVTNLLEKFFLGEIKQGATTHFTKVKPRSPKRAYTLAGARFTELAKLKDFEKMTLIAADLADETTIQTLLKNTAPNNTGFVVKKDVTENNNIIGSVYSLVQLPQKYANTITTIQKRVGDVHVKEDVNGLIDQLIIYKRGEDGKLLKKGNEEEGFSLVASESQPVLDFLATLDSTNLGVKKYKGRNATFLDGFLSLIHPFPNEHPIGKLNTAVEQSIKNQFASVARYDFKRAMNLIQAFTSKNTQATNILLEDTYGQEFSTEKVKADFRGKSTSAYNGIVTIDSMLQTYFTSDGDEIDINTAQGEVVLTAFGVSKFVRKGFQVVSTIFKGGNVIDVLTENPDTIANSFVDQNDIYDSVNENDPKEIAARERNKEKLENIKALMNGTGDVNQLIQGLDKRTKRMLGTEKGQEILRKLAVRQYHKYMLAYQLAAAIQGGTGGRTISDQDVENILRSLNFGFFTTADKERATLAAARKMLSDLYEYNEGLLNPNPSVQFAAIKSQQLLMGTERAKLFSSVAARRKYITQTIFIPTNSQSGFKRDDKGISDFAKQKKNKIESIILGKE